ncbi:threonine synthase [Paenibacillus koleovorans]|uniref:threonine synthase n=1 Tax=Paenibacillus koleovorans TaxID=121608 RepID=UPI000FDAE28D|nr:threonine synthase [Paenibacillus koleovorans]
MDRFYLRCTRCHTKRKFELTGRCACGGTLLVHYDLEQVAHTLSRDALNSRIASMWRYRELLPLASYESIVTLGEGWTPLIRLPRLERRLDLSEVHVKREEQNPTGSFKARGFSSTISMLHEYGITRVAVPSNGNAASAMAAYAARAGMEAYVIVPRDCPGIIMEECRRYGASTFQVNGLIHDAGAIIEQGKAEQGWFHAGTMKEPGRVEGKKTMGLEVAEQLDWKLPDVIIYPTGGGSGIVGLWKAFRELGELGWLADRRLPRLVSVQEAGCAPLVSALRDGGSVRPVPEPVTSSPTGLRVPNPPDGDLIASILRESEGTAVEVTTVEIARAQRQFGFEGLSSSSESAATLAALLQLRESGWIAAGESVVLFHTSHADKYLNWKPSPAPPVVSSYAELRQWL